MTRRQLGRLRRDAYSLTELLIVMVILVLMVSAALPIAKRVLDENRVREASRQLNAYISMAKTRAVLTGRPCGVYFELAYPLGTDGLPTNIPGPGVPAVYSRQSTRMYLAETPPPFAGSTIGAKGRIMWWPPTGMGTPNIQFCPLYYNSGSSQYQRDTTELAVLKSLIDEGEQFLVRFDYKGSWYRCIRGKASTGYPDPDKLYAVVQAVGTYYYPVTLAGAAAPVAPGYIADPMAETYTNPGYSYQILRSPKRVGNPLELTGGTCVDMNYSGMGLANNNSFRLASVAMAVMFTPAGGVTGIYGDGVGPDAPEGTIHFLIGRTTKVNNPWGANAAHPSGLNMFDTEMSNLADASTLWVSVGRQNGTTSTSENVPLPTWTDYTATGQALYLAQARSIATGREQTGGR